MLKLNEKGAEGVVALISTYLRRVSVERKALLDALKDLV
jgi:hypothetical protein